MTRSPTASKYFALLLALMLLLPLISCTGQGGVTPTPTTTLTPALTPTPTPAASAPPSTISSLSGVVLVQKQGSTAWVQAIAGMKLDAGDSLRTGDNGSAVLLFFEGSTMELQPGTQILINKLSLAAGTGSTNIGLKQLVGSTVNRVQKLVDSESSYDVETPAASAIVRGTIFKLVVLIDGNTTLNSEDGNVWFTAGGVTVLVGTGMQSFACVGCPPSNPSPGVTPTPTLTSTPTSTPAPTSTLTPTSTPIVTPTPTPTSVYVPPLPPTSTPEPTPTPTSTPTPTPTPTPAPTPTPLPSGFPQVQITSPGNGSTSNVRLISVVGTVVCDSVITGATITQNTVSRSLLLTLEGNSSYSYNFNTPLELSQGWNDITVAATNINGQSGSDTIRVFADIAACALRIELTWNTNDTDLDSHLIAPGAEMFDSFYDCYYLNKNPDWDNSNNGIPDGSAGDPSLDVDVTTGYGPEHIVLCAPPFNGIYQYKVYYFSDHGNGPSTATVRIWLYDELVFQGSRTLSNLETWDCACIDWPSGVVSAGPCATTTPTPTPTPSPTPTPTPLEYTLTVTSQGCCPILVSGLAAGNQTVPAGGNSTFSGIPANTQVMLTAQTGGNCSFEYWWVDEGPSSLENPYTLTMNSDHTAEVWCSPGAVPTPTPTVTPTPSGYTLTVTSQGCCPVLVKGLPGGDQTVPAGGSITFTGISSGTLATITAQPGGEICYLDYWMIDGVRKPAPGVPADKTIYLTISRDRNVIAVCSSYQIIIG